MSTAPPAEPVATPTEANPDTGHTPVSNTLAEVTVGPEAESPSADGSDPNVDVPKDGGEQVPRGFAEAVEEGFSLPKGEAALDDIAVASFGKPLDLAETVHGPDNRVQIQNTGAYPWRAHASLHIVARDNSAWIGTGWFIGPSTLVTAGHVVHIKNSNVPGRDGWVKSIAVMPGRNGNTLPYGSVTSTSFRSVTGWTVNGDQNYDYGVIRIPTDLGNRTGWFGYGVYNDADLVAVLANISGYPGDKPAGTQWYDSHQVASVDARKVYYDIDTMGGQSGSAVYRIKDGRRIGIAVHAYGGGVTNSGTRITKPVFDNLTNWNT